MAGEQTAGNVLNTPGLYGGLSTLLDNLSKPSTRNIETSTTTSTANTKALEALLAQLQGLTTAEGSVDLIKQIFNVGTQREMPGINTALQATGGRAGTSSYQALASSDLASRLAGEGAAALHKNVQLATDAAAKLALATQGTTIARTAVSGAPVTAKNVALGLGTVAAKSVLKDILTPKKEAAAALLLPKGAGRSELEDILSTTSGATGLGGLDAIIAETMGVVNAPGDITSIFTGTPITADLPQVQPFTMDSSNFFQGAGIDLAINALLGGDINSNTIGSGLTNAALAYAIPGAAPIMAAANLLGINEITAPVQAISEAAGGLVEGVSDAAGGILEGVSDAVGTVICTEFHRQGLLADEAYQQYAKQWPSLNKTMIRGYHTWAKPVVKWLQKGGTRATVLTTILRPFVYGRVWNITKPFNWKYSPFGYVTTYIGEPICWCIGTVTSFFDKLAQSKLFSIK